MSEAPTQFWAQGALSLTHARQPEDDFVERVASTWFRANGPSYRRVNVREQLARFEQPLFICLRDAGKVIGTYLIDRQQLQCGDTRIHGIYRGLLGISRDALGRGLGQIVVRETNALIASLTRDSSKPALSYGCIDAGNTSAQRILKAQGMREIGRLTTRLVYRQRKPRPASHVVYKLTAPALARWHEQLPEDALRVADPSFGNWVSLDAGSGRLAACRYQLTELCLETLTGVSGFVVEKLMPWFPPGQRRFNPRRFRYISISDPIATPGSDAVANRLVAHLMHSHNTHFAAITSSPRTSLAEMPGANVFRAPKGKAIRILGQYVNAVAPPPEHTPIYLHARDL
ncbi:MAG: GNAT family protein [Pseudomonadota bacterium]